MNYPIMNIRCFREPDGVFLIKASCEFAEYKTGKISFESKVISSGDYIDCKDPFDYKVYSGDQAIAYSIYDYEIEKFIESAKIKEWVNHIMIFDPKKWESGLRFKEIPNPLNLPERHLTEGKDVKLGIRFDDPEFPMTVIVGKRFTDKENKLYYGWWKIEFGPVLSYNWTHEDKGKQFYEARLKHSKIELVSFTKLNDDNNIDPDPDETDKDILIKDLQTLIGDLKNEIVGYTNEIEAHKERYTKLYNDNTQLQKDYNELKAGNKKPTFWQWLFGKK